MRKTVIFGLLVILLAFGFIGCDSDTTSGSDIIPSEFHGTWIWERGQYEHTITMTLNSTKITSVTANDPDTSKNGTDIYTVTNVTKGSTVSGWTTYNVTVSGMGILTFEMNSAGTQFRDINGTGDTYPRIYKNQLTGITYLWSEIDVVRTTTFTILEINNREEFNPLNLSNSEANQYWNLLFTAKNSLDEDNIQMTISELRARVLPEIGNNTTLMNQLEAHLISKGNILFLGGEVKNPVNSEIPEEGIIFVVKE